MSIVTEKGNVLPGTNDLVGKTYVYICVVIEK